MGDYTELHYFVELKQETPSHVIDILNLLVWPKDMDYDTRKALLEAIQLPDHHFFRTPRWEGIFLGESYYHSTRNMRKFVFDEISEAWFLSVNTQLKNYDREFQEFIDWADPYIEAFSGELLGYYHDEYSNCPFLIFKNCFPHQVSKYNVPDEAE
ncbi:MAG: hypothetical protein JRL30_28545 [Deltaproteobacteria bacterium]|nr:hypothetical protein [Deltaproteobacteria bacterium]